MYLLKNHPKPHLRQQIEMKKIPQFLQTTNFRDFRQNLFEWLLEHKVQKVKVEMEQ